MLTHIQIRHFAIIDELNLELYPGMSVMTGETGAGKSIMIDALSLCMGDRADPSFVRHGRDRAEIAVTLDITRLTKVKDWLKEHDLDAGDECIIRRTISKDGRSRAYINGESVPLTQLKALAEDFIDIHSQHAHHALLKPETHIRLLDAFGGYLDLVKTVKQHYDGVRSLERELQTLMASEQQKNHEMDLLQFQVNELSDAAPQAGEWAEITQQHDALSHAETIVSHSDQILNVLADQESQAIIPMITHLHSNVEKLCHYDQRLASIADLLVEARIQCEEAASSLRHYLNHMDNDPARLVQLNDRIALLHDLARKHRCEPEALYEKFQTLEAKLEALHSQDAKIIALRAQLSEAQSAYEASAAILTAARQKTCLELSLRITEYMQTLGMPGGEFTVAHTPADAPTALGRDHICFMVKTNPDQLASPLHKVASGGELSRISLALQVVSLQDDLIPVIVFDEVDVGIGGGTAEIVGHLLHSLGQKAQVLCVTHLPQVAARGDQHFYISKKSDEVGTRTQVNLLSTEQRIEELSRMLGGVKITDTTRSHAKEMLEG